VGDIVSVLTNIACGRCRNCKEGKTGDERTPNPIPLGPPRTHKDQAPRKISRFDPVVRYFPTGYQGKLHLGAGPGAIVCVSKEFNLLISRGLRRVLLTWVWRRRGHCRRYDPERTVGARAAALVRRLIQKMCDRWRNQIEQISRAVEVIAAIGLRYFEGVDG